MTVLRMDNALVTVEDMQAAIDFSRELGRELGPEGITIGLAEQLR